jgi:prevent-host-death family protein
MDNACHYLEMQPSQSMSVTDLKNKLLEVVRRVERGEVFEITKDGKAVAMLAPRSGLNQSPTGFARIEVKGDLDLPVAPWTYDVENLKPARKRKR